MANAARKVTAALAVSATLLTARAATAADAQARVTIVLHVDNFASLLPDDLNTAQTIVRRIFAGAGVRAVWADARDKVQIEGALNLRVLLLSREMGERKIETDGVQANVLGQASRGTGRAYIFTHRVTRLAQRHEREVGRVLGRIVAHEVGHLLLPVNSHSKTGIMCANLDMRTSVDPGFTSEQTTAIHAAAYSGN